MTDAENRVPTRNYHEAIKEAMRLATEFGFSIPEQAKLLGYGEDDSCDTAVYLESHLLKMRSGDVRARISALSEIDGEWERSVARWRRLNRRHQKVVRGRIVPDPNAELLVYQTLVGIWPAPRAGRRAVDIPERQWRSTALDRMKQYVLKAVREAKLRTSWTDPDEDY